MVLKLVAIRHETHFLSCLCLEIDPEVDFDSRRAVYFRQMRYGLFVRSLHQLGNIANLHPSRFAWPSSLRSWANTWDGLGKNECTDRNDFGSRHRRNRLHIHVTLKVIICIRLDILIVHHFRLTNDI